MSLVLTWDTESTVLLPTGGEAIRSTSEVLEIDIIDSDSYAVKAKITAHAVEQGVDVTDHTEPEQDRVTVQAAISARPMSVDMVEDSEPKVTTEKGRTFLAVSPPEGTTRKADAFEELRTLVRTGALVNVEGLARPLENYQIEAVTSPRKTETAGLLAVEIVFVEHRTAEVEEVDVPAPRVERGRRGRDNGRESAEGDNDGTADSSATQRSTAATALDTVLGREQGIGAGAGA